MSFLIYLRESLYKMDKVSVGLYSQIFEVYKNPKEYEMGQISDNFFQNNEINPKGLSKALRGILDLKNGYIYVWNANLLHDKAIRAFKLNDAYSLRLIFNPKNKVISVENLAYEPSITIDMFNKEAIQNLKNTGYKYMQWIDYDENDDNSKIEYDLNTMKKRNFSSEDDWE